MKDNQIGAVKGSCSNCGSEKVEFDPNLGDEAVLTCAGCGANLGTRGEFINRAAKLAKDEAIPKAVDELRKSFESIFKN